MTDNIFGKGALALVSALAIAAPVAVMPGQAAAFTFNDVRIEGAQRVDANTILSMAGVRAAPICAGELNDAQQKLQRSGLFESVELVPQGGTLVVRVQEYPTINVINFEGNRRLKTMR